MNARISSIPLCESTLYGTPPLRSLTCAVLLLLCFLLSSSSIAQNSFQTYDQFIEGHSIVRLADGGYIISGRSGIPASAAIDNASLLRVDVDGTVVWANEYGGLQRELAIKLIQDSNNDIVATGSTNSFGSSADALLFKTDINGNQLWMQAFGSPVDSDRSNTVIQTADGGYLMTGCLDCTGSPLAFLIKTDINGNGLWTRTYPIGQEGFAILQTADGGFVLAGVTDNDAEDFIDGAFLLKTDSDGLVQWSHTYKGDYLYNVYDFIQTTDGFLLTGGSKTDSNIAPDFYLLKTDLSGDSLWTRTYGGPPNGEVATALLPSSDGSLYLSGTSFNSGNGDLFLLNTTLDGTLNWSRTYGDPQLEENGKGIVQNPDGSLAIAGVSRQYDGMGGVDTTKVLLINTGPNGEIMDSYINGRIFVEDNANCLPDAGEAGFPRMAVAAVGSETYYGTTDTLGYYSIPVSAGTYAIQVFPPDYWQACSNPVNGVTASGTFDTTIVDIGLIEQTTCPLLEIDISTPVLRRGVISTYTANFCNNGPEDLPVTSIELTLDDDLLVTSISRPYTALGGNRYLVEGGALSATACNSFTIDALLNPASTVEGETHCVEARIRPDSICLPVNPIWAGHSIEVEGECVGDSVRLRIRNNSGVDMIQEQQFIVIEDMIIERSSNFQLNGQEVMEIVVAPEGKTIRFEAQQAPGHPGISSPAIDIEGCGRNGMNDFSRGIATVFPEDDGNTFISIDCQESQSSFDPHENKAYPKGKPSEHYILPNTDIEYHIRVQNTHAQTIQRLVIRDTLSPFVDPASLRAGASSHPYTFELYDQGIVKFTFENINLPSMLANEPASHAFIKFRIQQDSDLPAGTVITNRSAAFFDHYAPENIDLFFHTIERPIIYNSQQQTACSGEQINGIVLYADTTLYDTIALSGYDSIAIYEVEVFTSYNALLDTSICEGNELIFNGEIITEAGEYEYRYLTAEGCDSLEVLDLEVLENAFASIDTILDRGEAFRETVYTQDTVLTETYAAANGCDSILTINIIINSTSIPIPIEYDQAPYLMPNPGNGLFRLHFSLKQASRFGYQLYDLYGKKVLEAPPHRPLPPGDHQLMISIPHLPEGTYLLQLQTNSGMMTRKVLKI